MTLSRTPTANRGGHGTHEDQRWRISFVVVVGELGTVDWIAQFGTVHRVDRLGAVHRECRVGGLFCLGRFVPLDGLPHVGSLALVGDVVAGKEVGCAVSCVATAARGDVLASHPDREGAW